MPKTMVDDSALSRCVTDGVATFPPTIASLKRFAVLAMAYGLALAGAAIAQTLHVPLAGVLGALTVSAILAFSGFELNPPDALRKVGQTTIGAGIGLHVTAAVAVQVFALLPAMVLAALLSVALSAVLSVPLGRLARLDHSTAFFSMIPGGLAEMGNVGTRYGADPEPIAVMQALRVAIVVILLPPLLILSEHAKPAAIHAPLPLLPAMLLIAGCLVAAFVFRVIRLNNPWMLGAVLLSGTLTATGLADGEMPWPLFFGAQVILGFAIGSRFKRNRMRKLPQAILCFCAMLLVLMALTSAMAVVAQGLLGQPFGTMLLSLSPGGMSEMSTTAQVLGLGAAIVTGFHVVRTFFVNGFAGHIWILLSRMGFHAAGNRLWDRVFKTGGRDPDA
ncbi:MAG TPA: AbrB family transcriptional regulator [Devosia sp.]|nr:AbrB family transcriptional regulator [Devosia sp.]